MAQEVWIDTPTEKLLEAAFSYPPGSEKRENAMIVLKARGDDAILKATRNLGRATWVLVAATLVMAVAAIIR